MALMHTMPTFANAVGLVVLASLLAGCSGGAYGDDLSVPPHGTYALGGAFKETRTQADMQDLGTRVAARGGDLVIMESFPEQFRAGQLSASACDALHAELETVTYLSHLGSCSPEQAA